MKVVILGAAGFLGTRLAARLAAEGCVRERRIDDLVLFDSREPGFPRQATCKVSTIRGDIRDQSVLDRLFSCPVDMMFHLAAALTLDAETDFRRGLETNVLAFIELLERCRALPGRTMVLFASSISTFGERAPAHVTDDVFQTPTTSYGTHKVIAEQLIADYSRHGFIDGRALRLPIVLTHPGPATGSISDQVAALIREPLRGRAATCRIAPESRVVIASVDNVVTSFLRLASLPAEVMREFRTMNLPGLSVTAHDIVQAVVRRLPGGAPGRIEWKADAKVQRIIDAWPEAFSSERAHALGFTSDRSADHIVAAFLSAEGPP